MIGKQTKGTSFGGCVRYVLKEEKSKLLEAVGVGGHPNRWQSNLSYKHYSTTR